VTVITYLIGFILPEIAMEIDEPKYRQNANYIKKTR
jgi:hypothetical protein